MAEGGDALPRLFVLNGVSEGRDKAAGENATKIETIGGWDTQIEEWRRLDKTIPEHPRVTEEKYTAKLKAREDANALRDADRTREEVAAGVDGQHARRKWRAAFSTNTLSADFRLHFLNMGTATVAEVLANPRRFDFERLAILRTRLTLTISA